MPVKIRPNGRTTARNHHLPAVARRTMDAVTPIIQQQNHNALQVSSYSILIYQRLQGGALCTCSYAHPVDITAPVYDEEGKASSSTMQSIIHQASFGIEEYNPAMLSNNIVSVETVQPGNEETRTLIEPMDEFDFVTETSLNAYTSGACAICFGTGFRGGYQFVQGLRKVFQATDIVDQSGVDVDRTSGPYGINFESADSWASFRMLVPQPIAGLLPKITVWNNFIPIELNPYSITCTYDDPSIPEYELGSQGFAASGWVTLTLKASRFMVGDAPATTITHIEVQLPLTTKPTYADMPSTEYAFDATRLTLMTHQTVVLSPNSPLLMPRDVISDMQYRQHWLVVSSKPLHPASGEIWTQEVQVRPLEAHEPEAQLALPDPGWVKYYAPDRLISAQQSRIRRGGN